MELCIKLIQEVNVMRAEKYNTKQRDTVLQYMVDADGTHVTAAEIVRYCQKMNLSVGRTTVYRNLNSLVDDGVIMRYITEEVSGTCYQFIGNKDECQGHLHLRCEGCGELFHLECDALFQMQEHILSNHSFRVNSLRTILYGLCENCVDKKLLPASNEGIGV